MIVTELSAMFDLSHPIVLGPMGGVSGGRLAAAVSNAGGLGLVGGYAGPPRGANEPGKVEANPLFGYLDAFDNDAAEVSDLKERYARHGVSNVELRDRLTRVLNELLEPMRQRRAQYEGNMARVRDALEHGRGRARAIARETMGRVHEALDLDYLRKYR